MVRLRCGWSCLGEVGAVHDHGQAGVGGGRLGDQAAQVGDSREEDGLVGCDGNVAAAATRHLHNIAVITSSNGRPSFHYSHCDQVTTSSHSTKSQPLNQTSESLFYHQ